MGAAPTSRLTPIPGQALELSNKFTKAAALPWLPIWGGKNFANGIAGALLYGARLNSQTADTCNRRLNSCR